MVTETRPLRVFLSHASEDKPSVVELHQRLQQEGWIDSWLDKEKILPGRNWAIAIEEAVETSDVVIVFLSNHSVTKEGFVQRELRYAVSVAQDKPEDTIFLIPVKLEECPIPRSLKSLQWINYFSDEKEDSYKSLLEALDVRYKQVLENEEKERIRKEKEDEKSKIASRMGGKPNKDTLITQDANKILEEWESYKKDDKERQQEQQREKEQSRKAIRNLALRSNVSLILILGFGLFIIYQQIYFSKQFSTGFVPTKPPTVITLSPSDTPTSKSTVAIPTQTPSNIPTIIVTQEQTPISSLTHTPSVTLTVTFAPPSPEQPILILPSNDASLPQPNLPDQWVFVWQAATDPCHSIITIDGPEGQLLSDPVYASTGQLYRYVYAQATTIPNNKLRSWSWQVTVICPYKEAVSATNEFSVARSPFDWGRFGQLFGNLLALLGVLFTILYILGLLPFLLYFEKIAPILDRNPAFIKLLVNLEFFNWLEAAFKFVDTYQSNKIRKKSEPAKQATQIYTELDELSDELKHAINNGDTEKVNVLTKQLDAQLDQLRESNIKLNELLRELRSKYDTLYKQLKDWSN